MSVLSWNTACGEDGAAVTDQQIAVLLRNGRADDRFDARVGRELAEVGVSNPDRVAKYLDDPQLRTAALAAISAWPAKSPAAAETLSRLRGLALDQEFTYRFAAACEFLYFSPLDHQLQASTELLHNRSDDDILLMAVLTNLNRIARREESQKILEAPVAEKFLSSMLDRVEQRLQRGGSTGLLVHCEEEAFHRHSLRERVARLMLKHLDRFTEGELGTFLHAPFSGRLEFLLQTGEDHPDLIRRGLIDFFIGLSPEARGRALRVVLHPDQEDLKKSRLLQDALKAACKQSAEFRKTRDQFAARYAAQKKP